MSLEHEQALVNAFIDPARRARWLELLTSTKGRRRLLATLAHAAPLDLRYAHRVSGSQSSASAIEVTLRGKGAPEYCYALSEASDLDGRELLLSEALGRVVGYGMGTFLSCVPGRLGYFESEEQGERYILER